MPRPTTCPNRDVLTRFVAGQLPAAESAALEQHVSTCPTCVAELQTIRSNDPYLQTLNSDGPTPTTDRTARADVSAELARAEARTASLSFLSPPQKPDEIGRLSHYRVLKKLGAGG